MRTTTTRSLLCIGLLLASTSARAADGEPDPLTVGDSLPEFSLKDQFGVERFVDDTVLLILFSRDMEGGELLKTGLESLPEGALSAAHFVYVSDISGMPRLVARMFALPKMRKRPYPMLLDRTGEWTALLPGTPGRATFIHLDRLMIREIEELTSAEAVQRRIDALLAAPKPAR